MDIEFQGQLTKQQLYRAVFLANRPSRRYIIIWSVMAVLAVVVLIAFFERFQAQEVTFPVVLRRLMVVVIAAYFLASPYLSAWRTAYRLWKKSSARAPMQGRITGSGITYQFSQLEAEYRWEQFVKVHKTQDMVVLVTADGTMSIHPRNFFRDEGDWQKFLDWLKVKVKEVS